VRLANLPAMVYRARADRVREMRYVSDGAQELTGRPAHVFMSGRVTWSEIVHPDDASAVERALAEAVHERRPFSMVYRIVHPSAPVRWVLDRCAVIDEGHDGEDLALEGVITDVTELQRERAAIRESEARWRTTFEQAVIGLGHVSLSELDFGRWLHVNDRLCEMTGYSHDELLARTFQDITHPDDLKPDLEQVQRVLTGELATYALEKRYVRKDGRVFWVNVTASIVRTAGGTPSYAVAVIEDITDRKAAETALRDQEAWLRLAQAAGGVGLFDWQIAAQQARCSDYLFQIVGRDRPPGGTISIADAMARVAPADLGRVVADIERAFASDTAHMAFELRVVHGDGEDRWISTRGEIRRDAAGKPTRVIGAVHDITDRKRIDDELQRAHDRLSLALRAGQAGLWDWEMKRGPTAFVAAEYRDLYGLSPDEPFSYDSWLTRIYPPDRERVEAYGREVFLHGSTYSIEFRIEHPTRGLRWFGSMGRLYRDAEGRPERFSGINLDITALKLAEQARRESEERFRKIFENAATGIAITDIRGVFEQCNPAYTALLGYSEQDLRNIECSSLLHPEDRAANLVQIRRMLARELPAFEIENRYVRKTGETLWAREFVSVLTNEAGEPAHLVVLITDTTHRHLAEEELKEADRCKDEFIATLAHELRNPLAPLRTGIEVMKTAEDRGAWDRALGMMERQLGHMVRLIDDLLDVSRIGRGKVELKREPVPLQVVIKHAIETASPLIEARRHTLVTRVPGEPIWVEGDLTRLAQVVGNLLNNSTKYTPEGGHIELALTVEGGDAVLRLTDDGVGIGPDMLPSVFDLFAQSTRDRGRAQGGLGIGLFLVRRLVELHGGTVSAESPGVNHGTTMTIRLPHISAPGAAANPPQLNAQGAPAARRILVVDDNEDAAEMLATVLDLHGYETRVAKDGPTALTVAKEFSPEVAFLDIGLPGMSGHELARAMRSDPALSGTVLIALTGWGGQEDKRRTQEAGFNHHLTKPIDVAAVEAILARC